MGAALVLETGKLSLNQVQGFPDFWRSCFLDWMNRACFFEAIGSDLISFVNDLFFDGNQRHLCVV
jgi:hypothetical protein